MMKIQEDLLELIDTEVINKEEYDDTGNITNTTRKLEIMFDPNLIRFLKGFSLIYDEDSHYWKLNLSYAYWRNAPREEKKNANIREFLGEEFEFDEKR